MRHYIVFRTQWGYFGLAGTGDAVCRTCLPMPDHQAAEQELLKALDPAGDSARSDKALLRETQERVIAYYEGQSVDFSVDPPVSFNGASSFTHQVLSACREIGYGRTMTYIELAHRIGRANAARAVGRALASNPIPLIIPCHRVLRTDGGLGGFSAPGGTAAKQKMLRHEQSVAPQPCKSRRPQTPFVATP